MLDNECSLSFVCISLALSLSSFSLRMRYGSGGARLLLGFVVPESFIDALREV